MKKTAIRTAALASALLVCGTHAMADGRTDHDHQFSQQRYFDLPQNAESFGMAGTTVTTLSDSSSVLGNPAGLGFMKDADVSATYAYNQLTGNDLNTYQDIEQTGHSGHAVTAALPIGPTLDGTPHGNIGFGWSGYRGDANDAADTDTDGYRLHLSYGNDISSNLSLGYGVSYLHDNWEEQYTGDKVGMDDGVGRLSDFSTSHLTFQRGGLLQDTEWARRITLFLVLSQIMTFRASPLALAMRIRLVLPPSPVQWIMRTMKVMLLTTSIHGVLVSVLSRRSLILSVLARDIGMLPTLITTSPVKRTTQSTMQSLSVRALLSIVHFVPITVLSIDGSVRATGHTLCLSMPFSLCVNDK